MTQTDLEKSLEATPYKLEKAREKGQVPKSADGVGALVLGAAVIYLSWQGWVLCREQFRLDQALLLQAAQVKLSIGSASHLVNRLVVATLTLAAPFFLTLMVTAILGNVLQTGPVFSLHPIKPDWDRVNPGSGFKRVFSMQTLFLGARALLKLVVLSLVAAFAVKALLPRFFLLPELSPLGWVQTLLDSMVSLGLKLALALGLIALIDLVYTRRSFSKKMRMSPRELKDEIKHREGDPRIRARLKALRKEMLKRSLALRRTREADVVITNPTHVAVALRYVHGQMDSPQLVAKGMGHMAAAMRRLAAKHRIPVVQNPSLARAIFREMPLDTHVPPALYAQVAKIIIWILAQREAASALQGRGPRWQFPGA